MTIYKSHLAPTPLPKSNLYQFLFPPSDDRHNPEWPAYINGITGTTISRRETQTTTRVLALGLRSGFERLGALNVSKGNVILVFSPNSMFYPVILLAGLAAGVKISLASNAYTAPELAYQINDSQPTHLFVHPSLLDVARGALGILKISDAQAKRRIVLLEEASNIPPQLISDGWMKIEDLMVDKRQLAVEKFDGEQAHETALIFYSSGTTGLPKGVELTHYNLTSMLCSMDGARLFPAEAGVTRIMGALPLFHVYGCNLLNLYPLQIGIAAILLPKFEPKSFLNAIQTCKATWVLVAPPTVLFLANSPLVDEYDLSTLRFMHSAAAPLSVNLVNRVVERINKRPGHNVSLVQAYGITELSPTCTMTPYGRLDKGHTVGPLMPNLEARLVDDDGNDVDEGQAGELYIRGPTVMKGYLNKPKATRDSVTKDGWYKTGDIAIRDEDGYWSIVDRKKELIKYKGYQVAPAELESVLIAHPDVIDAGVIGIQDSASVTELPRAYVVPRDLSVLKSSARAARSASIAAWVKERVSHYKQLRGGVILVNQIPRSAAGKILRRELRMMGEEATEVGTTAPLLARL